MQEISKECYESRQEYEAELLSVMKAVLETYLETKEQMLLREMLYDGEDKLLKNRTLESMLNQSYLPSEIETYEETRELFYRQTQDMAKKAAESMKQGLVIPLEYLFRIFQADPFLKHCVMLSLVSELDSRFAKVYASLEENRKQSIPTLDFCICTYTLTEKYRMQLYEHVHQNKNKFWLFFKEDENFLNRKLCLERRIVRFLFYIEEDNASLKPFCRLAYTKELDAQPMVIREELVERFSRIMTEKKQQTGIYYIHGSAGVGKRFFVRHIYRRKNMLCMMVDAEGLKNDKNFTLLDALIREVLIRRSGLCIFHTEVLLQDDAYQLKQVILHCMEYIPQIFLLSTEKWQLDSMETIPKLAELELTLPDMEERMHLWKYALREVTDKVDITGLSVKYSFSPMQIMESVKEAMQMAVWEDVLLNEDVLYRACRKQISHRLGEKAALIKAVYDWEDLILPEARKKALQNACNQIAYHHQVYQLWGFEKKIAYGRGVSMLFYGPPGTGKTMGAQVMAKTLHLELYKVDLSSVMSKYIGETEKNLGTVFEEVKKSQSILFFDEADALFGKRSEVKDAQDKYANAETAYLLQKMEEYEGIIILATNYMQNFDEAFKRRIKFIIEFPFPGQEQRQEIWQKVYPKEAPLSEDVDFEYLARQFELSGSSIKNIAAASAFLAAAQQKEIGMEHILPCLREEVQKSGKMLHKEDFGEYYFLVI